MNIVQLRLIKFFFGAFFPEKDNEEQQGNPRPNDYYQILKVDKNCSMMEIKTVYRKASLMMHPDKVAQFAHKNKKTPEEIQHDFVLVKEAYETLSDPKRRNVYDVLGRDGAAFMNREEGNGLDIQKLVNNLSHATCWDRTKLFLLPILVVGFLLIGPILICAKVDASFGMKSVLSNVSWSQILIPFYMYVICFIMMSFMEKDLFGIGRRVSILVMTIFLALRWDHEVDWKYKYVLIPLFIHQALLSMESIFEIRDAHRDMGRMTTVRWLERNVIPTFNVDSGLEDDMENRNMTRRSSYDELTEQEKDMINKLYIIVEEDIQDNDESVSSIEAEANLLHAIAKSTEYKAAILSISAAKHQLFSFIIYHIAFLVLLVWKLDYNMDWSWHVVFIPIWVELCINTLSSCFNGCCAPPGWNSKEMQVEIGEFHMSDDSPLGPKSESTKNQTSAASETVLGRQESIDGKSVIFSSESQNIQHHELNVEDGRNHTDEDIPQHEGPHFDPETFEHQGQSLAWCCMNFLLILFLSLFLVKLDGSENEGNHGHFSAFWIIFPLFLVSFIVLALFACCIYAGSHADQIENLFYRAEHVADENNGDVEVSKNDELAVNSIERKEEIDDLD